MKRARLLSSVLFTLFVCDSVLAQCDPPLPPSPSPPGGPILLYSLNGQTIQAEADGSFVISNVAVPDLFPADNVGDDYLRIIGVLPTDQGLLYGCPTNQCTVYLYTETAFRMTPGGTYVLEPGQVSFRTTPPPMPESITVTTIGQPVLEPGMTRQLQTKATLTDGSEPDVSLASQWTTYRSSNAGIARAVETTCGGQPCVQVEAVSPGTAFITATNGGAASVLRITVANPNDLITTTVEGFVQRSDGSAVQGGMVSVREYGGPAVASGADGFFSIPLILPDDVTAIIVEAVVQTESQTEVGQSPTLTPVSGGITDAGIIVIELFCDTPWSTAFAPTTLDGGAVLTFATFNEDGAGPDPPALYAGGKFDKAGGTNARRIARWDGRAWTDVGGGVTPGPNGELGDIHALASIDLDGSGPNPASLYAVGYFVAIGGIGANKIARWDRNSWSALSVGVGDSHAYAYSIASFDDGSGNGTELYVGGAFCTAGLCEAQTTCPPPPGCTAAQSVAKWNPATQAWSPVGGGFTDTFVKSVLTLAVFDGELYAGGDFNQAEGVQAKHVAKWNGMSWTQVGGGLSTGSGAGRVASLIVFDDGTGPALYAGGDFFGAAGNYVAKWNGAAWTPLGTGLDSQVYSLVGVNDGVNPPALYASGNFSNPPGRLARWNGNSWSSAGTGLESIATAMTVLDDGDGPALLVGGEVCIANCPGGLPADAGGVAGIRSDERTKPTPLGREPQLRGGSDYAGFVAQWDDNAWSVLGDGLNNKVHVLLVHDDGSGPLLIAGGKFTPPIGPRDDNAAPFPCNGIAKFEGTGWCSLGTGLANYDTDNPLPNPLPPPAEVHALAAFDEDGAGSNSPLLFVGGDFTFAGGVPVNGVARWNGSSWSPVGNVGGIIRSFVVYDDDGNGSNPPALYGGGEFSGGVRKWNPGTQSWSVVGAGISSGYVYALAEFGDELYVGGNFTDAARIGANYLAKWNGVTWSVVHSGGSGVNGSVHSLHVFDCDGSGPSPLALYVGGEFTAAGGVTVNRIARWNGSSWSAVSTGLGPGATKVSSLLGFEDGQSSFLYVGGDFTQAGSGGMTLNRIARWSPVPDQWSAVGNGVDGSGSVSVSALAVFDNGITGPSLYAGGSFQTAGGVPASNIAKLGCH